MSVNIPAINSIITDYLSDDVNKTEVEQTLTTIFQNSKPSLETQNTEIIHKFVQWFLSDETQKMNQFWINLYQLEPAPGNSETPEQLMKEVLKSPFVLELYDKVKKYREDQNMSPVQVKFGILSCGACADTKKGIISIDKRYIENKKISAFIFELINVLHFRNIKKLHQDVNNKKITDRIYYAKSIERLESISAKFHDDIIYKSIRTGYMHESMAANAFNPNDFEEEWEIALKSDHARGYMEDFDRIQEYLKQKESQKSHS